MASCHCLLYRMMLAPFMGLERKLRKQVMVRRARMRKTLTARSRENGGQEYQTSKECQVHEEGQIQVCTPSVISQQGSSTSSSKATPAKRVEKWSVAEVAAWLNHSEWAGLSQRIR